jgi:hypothetical protein
MCNDAACVGTEAEQRIDARLHPRFTISPKMRPYLARLRVRAADFDGREIADEQQYQQRRADMIAILSKKRIPLAAARRAVAETLDAAARFQFRELQREPIDAMRRSTVEHLSEMIGNLRKIVKAISSFPPTERGKLNSVVQSRRAEFFDTETFNTILEEIMAMLPGLSPKRWADEALNALAQLYQFAAKSE